METTAWIRLRRAVVSVSGLFYRYNGPDRLTTSRRIDIQGVIPIGRPSYRYPSRRKDRTSCRTDIQSVVRIGRPAGGDAGGPREETLLLGQGPCDHRERVDLCQEDEGGDVDDPTPLTHARAPPAAPPGSPGWPGSFS